MTARICHGALVLLVLAFPPHRASSQEAERYSLRQIMYALGAAKSEGEDAVQTIKMFSGNTPSLQSTTMHLYNTARADFNGLIVSLITEQDPDAAALSAFYDRELDQSLRAEAELIKFVNVQVSPPPPLNAKGWPFEQLLKDVGNLFNSIPNFGETWVKIHQELTREPDEHRHQIEHELDGLRWQQFSKIP